LENKSDKYYLILSNRSAFVYQQSIFERDDFSITRADNERQTRSESFLQKLLAKQKKG
jgi:hypothetical protein